MLISLMYMIKTPDAQPEHDAVTKVCIMDGSLYFRRQVITIVIKY